MPATVRDADAAPGDSVGKPSLKWACACTGKRASVSPVIAPSSPDGVPPSSFARSITDSTYACEWL